MNRARGILRDEHGGAVTYKIMGDMIEYRSQDGEDGYAWNGEAWFGGDIDRFVIKTEGEGGEDIESAEIQALYSRAWDHVTDLQIGIRQDIEPNPSRTYLALGFETVLPYWFEVEGAVFVGERGQVLGRLDGNYDFQLTQRLVLQPRAEVALDRRGIGGPHPREQPAAGAGDAQHLPAPILRRRLAAQVARRLQPVRQARDAVLRQQHAPLEHEGA